MRFYGNGIVRLPRGGSLRFSKPEARHAKGYADVDKEEIIEQLIALKYAHDEAPKVEDDKPDKTELIKKAEALGIEVNNRWGVKKLTELIKEAELENG